MSQLQSVEEIKGKKIARVYQCFDELWLRFTDGDFVWFRIDMGYENDASLELVCKAPDLLPNKEAFIALELASREEVAAALQKSLTADTVRREQLEKEQLAKLLAKYPQQ